MNSNKENVQRKKKCLPVRHTLTSKMRMLKGNPLLMYELKKKLLDQDLTKQEKPEKVLINDSLKVLVPLWNSMNGENREKKPSMDNLKKSVMKPITEATKAINRTCTQSKVVSETIKPLKSNRNNINVTKVDDFVKDALLTRRKTSDHMMEKLNHWLKIKGKPLRDYQHLKCFDVQSSSINNKENISYIPEEAQNIISRQDGIQLAREALLDLHKLIREGYDIEQCEIWLKLIKNKYKQVEDAFEYWECRAAVEQNKGNMNKAIECYKNAIIQGAEVTDVDNHLDQLLHKFNLLNIDNSQYLGNTGRKGTSEEERNIFKSTIIQFAVQERTIKKKNENGFTVEKKMVATPVRRSTRVSRSMFSSTPKIQLFSTLEHIDDSLRQTLNFQCNKALKDN